VLQASQPATKKRAYKPRENVYFLSTSQHRAQKEAAAKKKEKPPPSNKIKSNVGNHSDYSQECTICAIIQQEDIDDLTKRRRVIWLKCSKCSKWLHEKCVPRKLKQKNAYLASRVIIGIPFDFNCC